MKTKPFIISKNLVVEAYKLVKANAGGVGVDRQSLADFDLNLKDNLYGELFSATGESDAHTQETGRRAHFRDTNGIR